MIRRQVHIGVGQDDGVVLRPAQCLDPLAVRCGPLVYVLRDRRRPDKGNPINIRVLQQSVDRFLVAVQDVEDAVGKARVLPQAGHQDRRRRVPFRGIEDECIVGGDGHRRHPQRHHHREVEWGDPGNHPQRLTERVHVDPGGDLVGVFTLELFDDPAGELGHLKPAANLTLRVGKNLAVLRSDNRGQFIRMRRQLFTEPEQDPGARRQRHLGPRIRSVPRLRHNTLNVVLVCQPQLAGHLTGCRIEDLLGSLTRP